ncbi:hypothetical protein CYMTET_29657, partial [Cymbomonas tetramitiformis]
MLYCVGTLTLVLLLALPKACSSAFIHVTVQNAATTGSCAVCPPGSYDVKCSSSCTQCPPGVTNNISGSVSCPLHCPPGERMLKTSSSFSCVPCPPGASPHPTFKAFECHPAALPRRRVQGQATDEAHSETDSDSDSDGDSDFDNSYKAPGSPPPVTTKAETTVSPSGWSCDSLEPQCTWQNFLALALLAQGLIVTVGGQILVDACLSAGHFCAALLLALLVEEATSSSSSGDAEVVESLILFSTVAVCGILYLIYKVPSLSKRLYSGYCGVLASCLVSVVILSMVPAVKSSTFNVACSGGGFFVGVLLGYDKCSTKYLAYMFTFTGSYLFAASTAMLAY